MEKELEKGIKQEQGSEESIKIRKRSKRRMEDFLFGDWCSSITYA